MGTQLPVGPSDDNVITVAALRSSTANPTGELAGNPMEIMLDYGSAVSLMIKEKADKLQDKSTNIPLPQVSLITASGATADNCVCSSSCENQSVI